MWCIRMAVTGTERMVRNPVLTDREWACPVHHLASLLTAIQVHTFLLMSTGIVTGLSVLVAAVLIHHSALLLLQIISFLPSY